MKDLKREERIRAIAHIGNGPQWDDIRYLLAELDLARSKVPKQLRKTTFKPEPTEQSLRIVDAVAEELGLSRSDIIGRDRHKSVAFARHVAMYLCRYLLRASTPEVGSFFGVDHSTVLSACGKMAKRIESSALVADQIQRIELRLCRPSLLERATSDVKSLPCEASSEPPA